jgi:serine/threonine-protein kinase
VTQDPERLARFRREAHVLAALNHQHIASIYGLEETDRHRFLVLEFVDGETLAARIQRGALPLGEAITIAREIAEALESAHEKGIVHRDLKPANIALTSGDRVKVLDFGLAKAADASGAVESISALNSPTITSPAMLTQVGMILGTAAYMSPEQARGKEADKRSDIWAFGCVLFEMLAGKRAFDGDDVTDVIAAVVRGEPDWIALPADVPEHIRLLLRRCLEKDRNSRVADISTARFLITEPLALSAQPAASATPPIARPPMWRRAAPFVVTAVAAGAVTGAIVRLTKPLAVPAAVVRFSVPLEQDQRFTWRGRRGIAISPDGRQFVYVVNRQLYLRELASAEARPIAGAGGAGTDSVFSPAFSPDGRSLVFYSEGALKRIAVTGGVAATVCPADLPFGISWDEGGIVFGQGTKGIFRVSSNGGTPELLVSVDTDEYADSPQVLPDGKVLFTVAKGMAGDRWERAQIVVQSPKARDRKVVIENASSGQYVSTGHILYARGGVLFASRFDPIRIEVRDESIPVLEGVRRAGPDVLAPAASQIGRSVTGEAQFSISLTGTLAYVPGPTAPVAPPQDLALVDRDGTLERLKLPGGTYVHARVSPDGQRVAFASETVKDSNVYVYTLGSGTSMQRLTIGGVNRFPVWIEDGKRIAFQSDREGDLGIFSQPADGGKAERLTKAEERTAHTPESWSPSRDELLYTVTKSSKVTLWVLSLRQQHSSQFPDIESTGPIGSAFSPDGHWVAYGTAAGVFVQPYPPTGAIYPVPPTGRNPHNPFWSRDGKELFYEPQINELAVVPVRRPFAFGTPVSLAAGRFGSAGPAFARNRDIDASGKRFIAPVPASETETGSAFAETRIVLNWFQELKERVPAK